MWQRLHSLQYFYLFFKLCCQCSESRALLCGCRQHRHHWPEAEVDPGSDMDADPALLHLHAHVGGRGAYPQRGWPHTQAAPAQLDPEQGTGHAHQELHHRLERRAGHRRPGWCLRTRSVCGAVAVVGVCVCRTVIVMDIYAGLWQMFVCLWLWWVFVCSGLWWMLQDCDGCLCVQDCGTCLCVQDCDGCLCVQDCDGCLCVQDCDRCLCVQDCDGCLCVQDCALTGRTGTPRRPRPMPRRLWMQLRSGWMFHRYQWILYSVTDGYCYIMFWEMWCDEPLSCLEVGTRCGCCCGCIFPLLGCKRKTNIRHIIFMEKAKYELFRVGKLVL